MLITIIKIKDLKIANKTRTKKTRRQEDKRNAYLKKKKKKNALSVRSFNTKLIQIKFRWLSESKTYIRYQSCFVLKPIFIKVWRNGLTDSVSAASLFGPRNL